MRGLIPYNVGPGEVTDSGTVRRPPYPVLSRWIPPAAGLNHTTEVFTGISPGGGRRAVPESETMCLRSGERCQVIDEPPSRVSIICISDISRVWVATMFPARARMSCWAARVWAARAPTIPMSFPSMAIM